MILGRFVRICMKACSGIFYGFCPHVNLCLTFTACSGHKECFVNGFQVQSHGMISQKSESKKKKNTKNLSSQSCDYHKEFLPQDHTVNQKQCTQAMTKTFRSCSMRQPAYFYMVGAVNSDTPTILHVLFLRLLRFKFSNPFFVVLQNITVNKSRLDKFWLG